MGSDGRSGLKLPVRVEQSWAGTSRRLVDADGITIASQPMRLWHGAAPEHDPELVAENFRRIAKALNARLPGAIGRPWIRQIELGGPSIV
jgi:hypothetical protein